jgi:hypothetical protein
MPFLLALSLTLSTSLANTTFSDQGSTAEQFAWTKLPAKVQPEQQAAVAVAVSAAALGVYMASKAREVVELPVTAVDMVRRLCLTK